MNQWYNEFLESLIETEEEKEQQLRLDNKARLKAKYKNHINLYDYLPKLGYTIDEIVDIIHNNNSHYWNPYEN
jgi:hypothetical protein